MAMSLEFYIDLSKENVVSKDEQLKDAELEAKVEKINEKMRENLMRMIGDKQDSEDIAYVMAEAYFRSQGLKLIEDKIYSGKKHIADLVVCDHDGKNLDIKIKYIDPLHYVILDFEVKNEKGKD